MAPEKTQSIDRLMIINGKWNTIHPSEDEDQSNGEVIPKLIIGTPEAKEKHFAQFLIDLRIACGRLDRVVGSKSVDRILRLNFVIYDFPKEETALMEAQIMEEITKLLPKVDQCLYFTHTSDRKNLTLPASTILDQYSKVIFCEYGGGKGIIYAGEGGILGGALYANIEPGPAKWNGEERYFEINQDRFEKVWNIYYLFLRNRVIELRRQFLIAQAYGNRPWKDTDLRKRIEADLQEFEEFISTNTLPLANDKLEGKEVDSTSLSDNKVKSSQSVFMNISTQLSEFKPAVKDLLNEEDSNQDSWKTINQHISIWTELTT